MPGLWVVTLRDGVEFVGWVSLRRKGGAAELGYRLRRAFWGHGYAFEAAWSVIDIEFARGLPRVFAATMAVNMRSRRVMEKLGLKFLRRKFFDYPEPLPGGARGDVIYGLRREEWGGEQLGPRRPAGPCLPGLASDRKLHHRRGAAPPPQY
jgi:RimJ/RimL family protein N-acetyltransferase